MVQPGVAVGVGVALRVGVGVGLGVPGVGGGVGVSVGGGVGVVVAEGVGVTAVESPTTLTLSTKLALSSVEEVSANSRRVDDESATNAKVCSVQLMLVPGADGVTLVSNSITPPVTRTFMVGAGGVRFDAPI